jgi:hypothetical protein
MLKERRKQRRKDLGARSWRILGEFLEPFNFN